MLDNGTSNKCMCYICARSELVTMPQLHLYVPEATARLLKRRAEDRGMALSRYLAEVVGREVDDERWPEGYFEDVLGAWEGGIVRPPQGLYEEREEFSEDSGWGL